MVECAAEEGSDGEEDDAQADGSPVERTSTADSVEGEGGDEGPDDVDDHETSAEQAGFRVGIPGGLEDCTRVDDDGGDPGTVLHQDLEPERQLDATTEMDVPRVDPKKHLDVVRARVLGL